MKAGNIESRNIQNVNEVVFDSGELATLDSYTKLMIHGDSTSDSTGKTVTNTETYDDNTVLMLHLDNNVTDSATSKTVTNNNVTFSSSIKKMGTHSALFNGTTAYLTVPDSADWYFGTGNFTIDCWVYINSMTNLVAQMLASQYTSTYPYWMFDIYQDGSTYYAHFQSKDASANITWDFGGALSSTPVGRWMHLAVVRNGSNMYIYENGVEIAVGGIVSGTGDLVDIADVLSIGRRSDGSYYLNGYLDEFRISKGTVAARWLDDSAVFSNPYGIVKQTTSQYKLPILSRSLEFDGSGDHLTLADSADWDFDADFTIDYWWMSYAAFAGAHMGNIDGANGWSVYHSGGSLHFYANGADRVLGTISYVLGQWYHVAIVRNSGNLKFFINGVDVTQSAPVTYATAITSTQPLYIGFATSASGAYLNGYMSEIRISKGIARWSSAFTPSTDVYGGPVTYLCATGLDGNTDEKYRIIARQIGGPVNQDYIRLSINEDNSGTHYGLQRLYGANATASAIRGTGDNGLITYTYTAGATSLGEFNLFAKSGYVRTMTGSFIGEFPTTYTEVEENGTVWNNTVDNITSLQGFGVVNNSIGAGSRLIVLRDAHASLLRTGTMDVIGKVKYAWQEIYNYEVGAAEDSYTKLLIHGDSNTKGPFGCLDSTGKTVTVPEVNDSYTKLMLHFDGADASTTFTDSSLTGRTMTAVGTAQLDTAKHKFQTASGLFDGNSDYLTTPDSADWNFGTGDFTIDCWVRFNNLPTLNLRAPICGQYDDANNMWWFGFVTTSGGTSLEIFARNTAGEIYQDYQLIPTITTNVWYHVAVVRNGTTFSLYLNGNLLNSGTEADAFPNLTSVLYVGWNQYGGNPYYFDGWMDELRISKGIARWTSDFTPWDIPYGSVGSTALEYKFPQIGRSFQFGNGGITYATVADSADWVFGTSPHTIDFWIRWDSITSTQISNIWMQYDGTGGTGGWVDLSVGNLAGDGYCHWGYWHIDDSSRFSMYIPAATASAFVADRWYHIAVVRIDTSDSSTSWRIYIDGVAQTIDRSTGGSFVSWGSANFFNIAAVGNIGVDSSDHASNPHYGQIADFRISNGVARWTSNFTPSTSPLGGPISNIAVPVSGNDDVLYKIKVKTVAGATTHGIRLNNNSSTDYRGQYLLGINTASSAARSLDQVYFPLNYNNLTVGDVNYSEGLLYAKSGYNRTYLGKAEMKIVKTDSPGTETSTIGEIQLQGNEWVNSVEEVTELDIVSIANNALGPGSHIIIERLNL